MKRITIFLSLLLLTGFSAFAQVLDPKPEPTDSTALLNVLVTNSTSGEPSKGDYISFTGKTGGKSYSGETGPDGKFSILLPKGETYSVKYKSFSGEDEYTEFTIPGAEGLITFDLSIEYELPKVYVLDNVYYDTGKSTLKPGSYIELNELAELLQLRKTMRIEISGHTDDVGEEAANQKLSEARANAVRNYLIKKGISPDRIVAVGYGETQPIAYNDTPEGRQKNRRTEVRILSE